MKLYTTRSFKRIKKDWEVLYKDTPDVSPFLNPETFGIAYRYFFPYYISNRNIPVFVVFKNNDETVAIVPILKGRDCVYRLLGAFNGFNECGFVYKKNTNLNQILHAIKQKFQKVEFQKIDERSPLSQLVAEDYKTTNNVAIYFECGHNEWFNFLSSHTRQNMRTSYNRMQTDCKQLNISILMGGGKSMPINDIITLYCSRHEQRYGLKTSPLKKWFLKRLSFATRLYRYAPNALTVVLYIDGKLAAFLSGLYSDNRLIVPRLSINNEFRRYSPGMLLVNETIKHLENKTKIRCLDLSMGEEAYKFQLGGTIHKTFSFKL